MKVFALVVVIGFLAVQAVPVPESQSPSGNQKPQISTLPATADQLPKNSQDQKPHITSASGINKPSRATREATSTSTTEDPNSKVSPLLTASNPNAKADSQQPSTQDGSSTTHIYRPVRDTQSSTTSRTTQSRPVLGQQQQTKEPATNPAIHTSAVQRDSIKTTN